MAILTVTASTKKGEKVVYKGPHGKIVAAKGDDGPEYSLFPARSKESYKLLLNDGILIRKPSGRAVNRMLKKYSKIWAELQKRLTEKQKLAAVRSNPRAIQFIDNPSEDLQFEVLEKGGAPGAHLLHQYVKNLSQEVQMLIHKKIGK